MAQSKYWCFTINNYTVDDEARLTELGQCRSVEYLTFGREVGDGGTPHLQGFVIFSGRKRFGVVQRAVAGGAHIEKARGTPFQAAQYCHKEGDFLEFGERPVDRNGRQGNRGQFAEYVEWCSEWYREHEAPPNEREIARQFPALFVRYSRALLSLTGHLCPTPSIQDGELRDWQIDLNNDLQAPPDDRSVIFVVDPEGGKGKTFFYRWFYSNNSEKTQLLSVGKRDDIAHAVDPSKSVFLFNVPRGGMEYLQYTVLEQLKDRVVFSPKYNSSTKLLLNKCHVVVFCNEAPDQSKMSEDRFCIIDL